MRRAVLLMLGLLAVAAFLPTQAGAQFPDPRALLGRMTAPFRHMLPHSRTHQRPAARAHEAAAAPRPEDRDEAGKLGVVGPRTWPTAYEDVIGYTFWPQDYELALRQHGYGDIVTAIVTPTSGARSNEARARVKETTGASTNDADNTATCSDTADVKADWPKSQIEQTVKLDDAQRNALDRLQAIVNKAAKSVRVSMCGDAAQTPTDRLEVLLQRLWAVQNATVVIRGPLKNFYDTLSDEQKAKFRVAVKDTEANAPNSASRNPPMGRAGPCARNDDRLMKEINQTVRPGNQQKKSVELLDKTAGGMNQYLMASCAQPTAEDPLARLDAVNARLTTINYAATSMEVALNQFAAALNDEQRKKFDAMGR